MKSYINLLYFTLCSLEPLSAVNVAIHNCNAVLISDLFILFYVL